MSQTDRRTRDVAPRVVDRDHDIDVRRGHGRSLPHRRRSRRRRRVVPLGEALGDDRATSAAVRPAFGSNPLDRVGIRRGDCSSPARRRVVHKVGLAAPGAQHDRTTIVRASAIATPKVSQSSAAGTPRPRRARRNLPRGDPASQRHPSATPSRRQGSRPPPASRRRRPRRASVVPRARVRRGPHRKVRALALDEPADADQPELAVAARSTRNPAVTALGRSTTGPCRTRPMPRPGASRPRRRRRAG